nr:nuclear envelope integral membrane protein 1 [Misgurnus anguillicaudatus]
MAGLMKCESGLHIETVGVRVFWITVLFCFQFLHQSSGATRPIIEVKDGQEIKLQGAHHFCYNNTIVPGWRETWTRIQVRVWSTTKLKVTVVNDEQDLLELEHFSIWQLVQYFIREQTNETTVSVNLFNNKTCFRVDPSDSRTLYSVQPSRHFDIYMFLVFLAGVLLFLYADILSRSQVFYYSAGMSTGMIASLIIIIFVLSRFLPKKMPVYALLMGGWSFALYIIQLVFRNLQLILKEHWLLAIGYATVVGFVSFAVCYRYGPLVEERSINILSWTLQIFGLLLVYAGIQVQAVALAVMLAAFCSKNLEYPFTLTLALYKKLMPRKPEPRRLLTEEEYQRQGEAETQKALDELRKYCSSPEFNTWKTVSRLQSPKRFADFIEGSPHLLSNEVSVHTQEYRPNGSFLEDDLFSTDEENLEEEEEGWETDDDVKSPVGSPQRNNTRATNGGFHL